MCLISASVSAVFFRLFFRWPNYKSTQKYVFCMFAVVCVCLIDTGSWCVPGRRGRGGVLLSSGEENETCTDDGQWEGPTNQRNRVSTVTMFYVFSQCTCHGGYKLQLF